ncbi:primosomal protein N' [Mycoplasmatota bacterium zrk1]
MIAKVIVDVNKKQLNRPFDYLIPSRLIEVVEKGMRVIVPFGARTLMGFVIDIIEGDDKELKEINDCFDVIPSLSEELLSLAIKLANETASTYISTFKTMLPVAIKAKYRKYIIQKKALPETLLNIFKKDRIYLDELSLENLKEVKKAIKTGTVELFYDIKEKASIQFETYLRLEKVTDLPKKAYKQLLAYDYILKSKNIRKRDVVEFAGLSAVNALIKKGIVSEYKEEVYRNEKKEYKDKIIELSDEQLEVINQVKGDNIFLLHGVTGSGKTEVYLEIIERTIQNGKEAILLVPEIALTYQVIDRFKARLKDNVAILHSGLSIGERYDEWRKIIRKEVKCVIGARSAIFAPLGNIGVIVIDEEHESTYKQEDMPRYHAREVAKLRTKYYKCPLILGSATPSLESYARAKKGVYKLLELKNRALNAKMPKINIIDMKNEDRLLSNILINEIINRVKKNEQVILLLNRRGYSNFVLCKDCGEVEKCPHCDISLTYHKYGNKMVCHYCGYAKLKPKKCSNCESKDIDFIGIGTESAEEELKRLIPNIRVLRMDQDTTSRKNAHKSILDAFADKKADILLGTQMIAKGLDFENVTLVGVIACDLTLNISDFRASERTYQLLTQVGGRAGRRSVQGEVILQTYNPEHYAISSVTNDYLEFYKKEMYSRKIAGYVPYYYIETIRVTSKDERLAMTEASKIASILKKRLTPSSKVLGPVAPYISKLKNRYRIQVIIKYKIEPNLGEVLSEISNYQRDDILISIDRYPNFIG